MNHPTCEELGIDPDDMWAEFCNYVTGQPTPAWYNEKVVPRYGRDYLVIFEVWCRRERIRVLEARLQDLLTVAMEARDSLAIIAKREGSWVSTAFGASMALTAAMSRASKGMKVTP